MQFKELVKKIIWPNRYNNEAFVSFLKKKGAKDWKEYEIY